MTDLSPTWAVPDRVVAPKQLQGSAAPSSSFARSQEFTARKSSAPASTAGHAPASTAKPRSGFATRPRPKTKSAVAHGDFEDFLPPTRSIRGNPFADADLTQTSEDSHLNAMAAASALEPIVIFGFPPGSVNEVLLFFAQFGEIVENMPGTAAASLECGRNWLKITYKSPAAAKLALAQNGRIMPGQYVIGCVRGDQSVLSAEHDEKKEASKDGASKDGASKDGDSTAADQEAAKSGSAFSGAHAEAPASPPKFEQGSTNALLLDDNEVSFLEGKERIVPKAMPATLLKSPERKQEKPLYDYINTRDPAERPPQGLVGRVFAALGGFLFGWD